MAPTSKRKRAFLAAEAADEEEPPCSRVPCCASCSLPPAGDEVSKSSSLLYTGSIGEELPPLGEGEARHLGVVEELEVELHGLRLGAEVVEPRLGEL